MQGVPKDFTSEGTLRACLGEIDRCYSENIMPFFVNMTRCLSGSVLFWVLQQTQFSTYWLCSVLIAL